MLADANCLANKLAGAKLRKCLDIKSKYLYSATEIDSIRGKKKGCDVQNIVTTVIIRVGSDALWGQFEKKKNNYENIIIFSLKCSS